MNSQRTVSRHHERPHGPEGRHPRSPSSMDEPSAFGTHYPQALSEQSARGRMLDRERGKGQDRCIRNKSLLRFSTQDHVHGDGRLRPSHSPHDPPRVLGSSALDSTQDKKAFVNKKKNSGGAKKQPPRRKPPTKTDKNKGEQRNPAGTNMQHPPSTSPPEQKTHTTSNQTPGHSPPSAQPSKEQPSTTEAAHDSTQSPLGYAGGLQRDAQESNRTGP